MRDDAAIDTLLDAVANTSGYRGDEQAAHRARGLILEEIRTLRSLAATVEAVQQVANDQAIERARATAEAAYAIEQHRLAQAEIAQARQEATNSEDALEACHAEKRRLEALVEQYAPGITEEAAGG